MSEAYGLPHVKITDVVELAESLPGESGDEIRKYISSKKDETMEEFEKSKKKGQELSRDEIVVRLPDNHIHTLTKMKLTENVCRNKGYILDGFPKTYLDLYHTFYNKKVKLDENGKEIVEEPKKPEGEGEEEPPAEGEGEEKPIDWENDYEVDHKLLPKILFNLTGDQEEIKNRVKELPEEKTAGTHWDDAGLDRRNEIYNANNTRAEEGEEDKKLFIDFFTENSIKVIDQNCLEEEEKVTEVLKQMITDNFIPPSIDGPEKQPDSEILQQHLEKLNNAPEEEEVKEVEDKQKEEKVTEAKAKSRLEKIKEQERELLDARSQPIRQYLMDKVVPLLTEGLIKI